MENRGVYTEMVCTLYAKENTLSLSLPLLYRYVLLSVKFSSTLFVCLHALFSRLFLSPSAAGAARAEIIQVQPE
jgi:hypothetical protein